MFEWLVEFTQAKEQTSMRVPDVGDEFWIDPREYSTVARFEGGVCDGSVFYVSDPDGDIFAITWEQDHWQAVPDKEQRA